MTIIVQGFVVSVSRSNNPKMQERLRIQLSADRSMPDIEVDTVRTESAAYRPGTTVELRIVPLESSAGIDHAKRPLGRQADR